MGFYYQGDFYRFGSGLMENGEFFVPVGLPAPTHVKLMAADMEVLYMQVTELLGRLGKDLHLVLDRRRANAAESFENSLIHEYPVI